MAKKKAAKKPRKKGGMRSAVPREERVTIVLRLDPRIVGALDAMALQVGMSRNALAALMLRQSASLFLASEGQPGLFAEAEQLIEGAIKQAIGKARAE